MLPASIPDVPACPPCPEARVSNIGSYNGKAFDLVLTSLLGIDSNCGGTRCSIDLNRYGTVNFYIAKNEVHPVRYTVQARVRRVRCLVACSIRARCAA